MKRATWMVVGAYVWWGLSPLFWRQLADLATIDQLSWRVVFGVLYLAILNRVTGRHPTAYLSKRSVLFGVLATVMIVVNWSSFLWAVANNRAVEAAFGYFLMPVFSVVLGVVVLGERPRRLQSVAVVTALIGIGWVFLMVGGVPWVALVVGSTFAVYGLARKVGGWPPVEGQTFEMAVVVVPLAVVLAARIGGGHSVVGDGSLVTLLFVVATGLVTITPLLLFATATRAASLTTVGLLQYINPTLQFLVGWLVFREAVSATRFVGFVVIWIALVLVIVDEIESPSN